jgi:hypothetical protein
MKGKEGKKKDECTLALEHMHAELACGGELSLGALEQGGAGKLGLGGGG